MRLEGVAARTHDVADDVVQVEANAPFGFPLPGEREQITHDLSRARGLVIDRLQREPRLRVHPFLEEKLREAEYRRERIVQLVRDAGQGRAERRHAFGAPQRLLMPHAFGDVFGDTVMERDAASPVGHRPHGKPNGDGRAVLSLPTRGDPFDGAVGQPQS